MAVTVKNKKTAKKQDAAALAANKIFEKLETDKVDRDWMIEELLHGGPPHKQLLSSTLILMIGKMLSVTEKQTGRKFELQHGPLIPAKEEGWDTHIQIPATLLSSGKQKEEELKMLSHAPVHEQLLFGAVFQAIEWCVKVSEN